MENSVFACLNKSIYIQRYRYTLTNNRQHTNKHASYICGIYHKLVTQVLNLVYLRHDIDTRSRFGFLDHLRKIKSLETCLT